MRLKLRLPVVEPDEWPEPSGCLYAPSGGQHFRLHQRDSTVVRDTVYEQVTAWRY